MKKVVVFAVVLLFVTLGFAQNLPKVIVSASSKGNTWAAARDQTMEMQNDFQRDCPTIQIVVDKSAANYGVGLSHMEVGAFVRDNQFSISANDGRLVKSFETRSIDKGVKQACDIIAADFKAHPSLTNAQYSAAGLSNQDAGALQANALAAKSSGQQSSATQAQLQQAIAEGKADMVIINSDQPNSELWIDGKKVTNLPFVFVLQKRDAPRVLMVKAAGFEDWTQTIEPDGQTLTLKITMKPVQSY